MGKTYKDNRDKWRSKTSKKSNKPKPQPEISDNHSGYGHIRQSPNWQPMDQKDW